MKQSSTLTKSLAKLLKGKTQKIRNYSDLLGKLIDSKFEHESMALCALLTKELSPSMKTATTIGTYTLHQERKSIPTGCSLDIVEHCAHPGKWCSLLTKQTHLLNLLFLSLKDENNLDRFQEKLSDFRLMFEIKGDSTQSEPPSQPSAQNVNNSLF